MDVTTTDGTTTLGHPLKSWLLSPRRIGNNTYQGKCVVAEALHVHYQKESSVHGRTAGVFGFSDRGTGVTMGGGGYTATSHRDVVQVVFRDEDGAQQTHELPAKSASTVGCVTRLDMIGDAVVGCRNLSGKGQHLQLHDASSFIPVPVMTTFEVILGIVGALMILTAIGDLDLNQMFWGALIGALPAWKFYRMQKARSGRRELNGYIGEVFS